MHLDSPLRSLALKNLELAQLVANATRRAFTATVDLCLNEQADALLLSGDLYDGDQTSMKTARFLAEQLRRLHEAGIGVFIVRGNHDALSKITRELTLPESVKVFSGRAEAVELACSGRPVAIHGLSFARPEAPESLLPRYKPPLDGAINIGLLHTSLNGSPGHDPYAPCALEDLHAAGFRYWALGHIHKRSVAKGAATVVMPGIPQGRDINEAGPKSVTLVTVDDAGAIEVEERLTSIAQFERVNIELSGCTEWREAVGAIRRALEQMRGSVVSEHGIARLRLTGATPLAWRLRQDPDLLLAEAENEAAGIGKTWIEKIEIECRPAQPGLPSSPDSAVPLGELHRLMSAVIADQTYQDEMVRHADHLRGQLPPECREFLGRDEAAFREFLREASREGAEDVLACLAPAEKAERD